MDYFTSQFERAEDPEIVQDKRLNKFIQERVDSGIEKADHDCRRPFLL